MTFDVALVMRKHGGNPAAITAEGMLFDKKRCQSAFLRVVKSLTLHIIIEGKSEKFNNDFRGEGDGNPQVQNARCAAGTSCAETASYWAGEDMYY